MRQFGAALAQNTAGAAIPIGRRQQEDDRATGMPLSQASSAETLGATSGALFSDFRAAQEAAGLTVTAPRHVAVSLRRAPSGVPSGPPVLPLTNSTQALPGKLDRIA
jgi:hypothetical protein